MAVRIMPIVTICVNQFSIDIPTACFEFEGALFDPRGIYAYRYINLAPEYFIRIMIIIIITASAIQQ